MKQVNKEKQNLLLIFTRNPELGKCKTRLAAVVGDKIALEIYRFLLQHTVNFSKNIKAQKEVHYSEEIWDNDIWDNAIFDKKLQQGLDLGERMLNAFETGFKAGFNKIIVIGSDMFDISTIDLDHAFEQLDTHDYVVGPAEDGGYYLLGMTASTPNLFKNKDWGKETVLQDSLNNLSNENVKILDIKNDVDQFEDIKDIEIFQPFLKDIKI